MCMFVHKFRILNFFTDLHDVMLLKVYKCKGQSLQTGGLVLDNFTAVQWPDLQ